MFSIRKTGEGYYLATLTKDQEVLSRIECNHLKRELSQIVKPHREISINLKGVKNINKEGYRILEELKWLADQRKCKIRYINVDPLISPGISKLTEKKIHYQDEPESF